jgi:DNA repair exonuclease SbcCD ATPase subunit
MNGIVKDRLSNIKDLISDKKHNIDLTQQKYDILTKHINQVKQNNDEKIKEHCQEIESNINTVTTLLAEINTITTEVEELQLIVDTKVESETKVKKITKLESQIESNLSKIRKDISFFEEHDDCPTCRQSIEDSFKVAELKTLSTKSEQCELGLKELEQKLLSEQVKLNSIFEKQKTIQKKQVKIATNNATIAELTKYNSKLQKQIDGLNNTKSLTENEDTELKTIKGVLDAFNVNLKEFIDEKTYLEVAGNLLKDTGIKTKIVRQYLPIINKLVNKYLASLDFFVNFNLDESFKETIKSRHRDEFSYNNFSEGEKQRIDMSLMLTWRAVAKLKNSTNTNLLILDEVFDSSLDNNGTEYLMNILHMLEGTNLFVISHKGDILQDKFSNVVRFQKVKNFSKVIK